MRFSAVPLGQKFTALLVAVAAAYGIHTWLEHRAVETAATAQLSFSLHAARRLDAGFVHAKDPAVVFAESVLSDQRIADLSKPAYLATSGMMSRVGEFRSRLELTQPSVETLGVRFRDPDSARAAQTANAVANALVAWSPSPDGPAALTAPPMPPTAQSAANTASGPPAAKPAQPERKVAPAAAKTAPPDVKKAAPGESAPLVAALRDVQAQLSTTSRQVEEAGTAGHGGPGYQGRAYAESEQQRLLKTQVRDAEKKVSDLRAQYGSGENGRRLETIHQALASVLAGGGVGVSARQLSLEREGLTRAMSVVDEQRAAIEKESPSVPQAPAASAPESADASGANSNAAQASGAAESGSNTISESDLTKSGAPAAAPANPQPTASSSSQTTSPVSDDSTEDPSLANPFRMDKEAGVAVPVQWWPAAAAGAGCGLLYWLLMASLSGRRDVDEAYGEPAEENISYGRFITSDSPARAAAPEPEPDPADVVERGANRRASFTWDPGPEANATRLERGSVAGTAAEEGEPIIENPQPQQVETVPGEAPAGLFHEETATEKVVEIDPWADLMEKALSETEIGRKLEMPKDHLEEPAGEDRRPRIGSDRWAS
jgi:hypothetical protein